MAFLSFLCILLLLIFSAQASANTLNRNFWAPPEGQTFDTMTPKRGTGFSSTDLSIAHKKYKNKSKLHTKTITEYMGYGLTNRFTISGEIGRDWDKLSHQEISHNQLDHWFLGSGYRFIDDGKNILNGFIAYGQKNNSYGGGMLKGYSVYGIYGHNFDTFSPHTTIGWNQSINAGQKNDEEWYWYGGSSIPLSQNFSAEIGLDYDHQASAFTTWGGYASISYLLNDFLTTELYSQSVLHNSVKNKPFNDKIEQGHTIGLRITTTF